MNQPYLRVRILGVAASLALLGGCASLPTGAPGAVADCAAIFERLDHQIEGAGLRDGGPRPVAGFPHLRRDRLLASLATDARSPDELERWLALLRQQDLEARWHELSNLYGAPPRHRPWQAIRDCSARLAAHDLASPPRIQALRKRSPLADDYSLLARSLGIYPLTAPFLKLGIRRYQESVREDYARPASTLDSSGELRLWAPTPASIQATPPPWSHDALGLPQLEPAQWETWLDHHAPSFLIETTGEFDRPGQPRWHADGQLGFDPARPSLYRWMSLTRYRGAVLPQLNYLIWFSRRPAEGALDPYAGQLDGLIWRVTLDAGGQVLLYDSIHACGCYHYFFPVQELPAPPRRFWQEAVLQPQGPVEPGPVVLRLGSGTHYLRRVLPRRAVDQPVYGRLDPVPYADLRSLPRPDGSRRSLFQPDGIVAGSQRLERYWLWPSGVPDPGAMRQNGRHATAFVGTRHFDDAYLLDQLFPAPP